MLIPSIALFLFASGIENGAGTGWTINDRSFFVREDEIIKLFSMRGTILVLCTYITIQVTKYINKKFYVKIFVARIKYAWVHGFSHSAHQRLNREDLNNTNEFEKWLVGITDGDGTFSIYNKENKWNLTFKIDQSRYNLRLLFYIKKRLGAGKVKQSGDYASFVIRDRKSLNKHIFPIFDKHLLLTSKYFNYLKFRKVYSLLENLDLSPLNRKNLLLDVKNKTLPDNYISPIWNKDHLNKSDLNRNILSKSWLVGFIEAKGSFYIVKKDDKRLVHGFGLSQKLDLIVLENINRVLGIPTKVRCKPTHCSLDTTNYKTIENIISYFNNTMKGMKSFEYRLWARSYNKHKGDFNKLHQIREIMRNTRKNLSGVDQFQ